MKIRKDENQGHPRDFKLCICLNGVGVSSEIIPPPPSTPPHFPLTTTALKNLTLKAARHWVVNLILRCRCCLGDHFTRVLPVQQLACRRLQELTPYVHCMTPADGLYGVQVLMPPLHCKFDVGEGHFTSIPLSEEFVNVDKIGISNRD